MNAFVKISKEKGYRLVGCERYGFNAIFIREDFGKNVFPEIKPETCFQHPRVKQQMKKYLNKIKKRKWVKV